MRFCVYDAPARPKARARRRAGDMVVSTRRSLRLNILQRPTPGAWILALIRKVLLGLLHFTVDRAVIIRFLTS